MPTVFLIVLVLAGAGFIPPEPAHATAQASAARAQYFKEDHLTGANYLWLRVDGTYLITGREHMALFELETGRWNRQGDDVRFTPFRKLVGGALKEGGLSYAATEVAHGTDRFLAFESREHSPAMAVSIDVTIAELRRQPARRPLYVFFEIDQTTFNKETQVTFPLRRVSPQSEPKGLNPPAAGRGRSDRLN